MMDDFSVLRELASSTPLPDLDDLAPVRSRLAVAMSAAVTDSPVSERLPAVRIPRRRARRVAIAAFVVAAAASAISAVLVLAPAQTGGQVSAANAEAAQVLRNAAAAALKLPDASPRPDQFVYQQTTDGSESWLSADGTRDGLLRRPGAGDDTVPGCRDGRRVLLKGGVVVGHEQCVPDAAYRSDLPTDVEGMIAYLHRNDNGKAGDANAMGKDILFMMDGHYLRPRSQAVLFEAAAKMPGLRVVKNITDAAGRPGVGIAWSTDGKDGRIVFDAKTYAYLGVFAGKGSSTVLRMAIVDNVGQRPTH
jgi:hypothetical protein